MPKLLEADPVERTRIVAAIAAIDANAPTVKKLKPRAARGSLRRNLATVAIESDIARHRIEKLYPDIAKELATERGSVVPMRQRLDGVRAEKATLERKLGQSHAYAFRLLEEVSKLRAEVVRLNETIAELEAEIAGDGAGGDPIGLGDVVGVPPMPARGKARGRG